MNADFACVDPIVFAICSLFAFAKRCFVVYLLYVDVFHVDVFYMLL